MIRRVQADSIVPDGVQGLDRYAYANNNPLKYTDPSGHMWVSPDGHCGGGTYAYSIQDLIDATQINVEKLNQSDRFIVTRAAQAVVNGFRTVPISMSPWQAFSEFRKLG
jgi:hypothetical protein